MLLDFQRKVKEAEHDRHFFQKQLQLQDELHASEQGAARTRTKEQLQAQEKQFKTDLIHQRHSFERKVKELQQAAEADTRANNELHEQEHRHNRDQIRQLQDTLRLAEGRPTDAAATENRFDAFVRPPPTPDNHSRVALQSSRQSVAAEVGAELEQIFEEARQQQAVPTPAPPSVTKAKLQYRKPWEEPRNHMPPPSPSVRARPTGSLKPEVRHEAMPMHMLNYGLPTVESAAHNSEKSNAAISKQPPASSSERGTVEDTIVPTPPVEYKLKYTRGKDGKLRQVVRPIRNKN